jgi:hypothetical protein
MVIRINTTGALTRKLQQSVGQESIKEHMFVVEIGERTPRKGDRLR